MWWNHDFGWDGWMAMAAGMTAFWVLVVILVIALVRAGRSPGLQGPDARQTLDRRLADGSIDPAEYRRRLAALNNVAR